MRLVFLLDERLRHSTLTVSWCDEVPTDDFDDALLVIRGIGRNLAN